MANVQMYRTLALVFAVALVAGLFALPASAQETTTYTITEQQINDSFRVNNPRRWRVSSMSVDLKPDTAMITAIYETRGGSVTTSTTLVPSVEDGHVYWSVTDVTANGSDISDDLLQQINDSLEASWVRYAKGQINGYITDVTITETEIIYTQSQPDAETNPGRSRWWGFRQNR